MGLPPDPGDGRFFGIAGTRYLFVVCQISRLGRNLSSTSVVIPLLNGIDIYERIHEDLRTAQVLPACVYVGTHIETYGRVTQTGGACKILFGRDPQSQGPVPDRVFDLFSKSRVKYEWFEDVYPEIWGKYVFISAFGLVTAAFDKTIGQVMESDSLSREVLSVMEEIVQTAKRMGVVLPETITADSYRKGGSFAYETKTSFQRDVESADKPDERDLFAGAILRLGSQMKIDTPATRKLLELINRKKPLPTGDASCHMRSA